MATKAIVVTLGLALPDKTWVEKIVKFDWNSESDDLAEVAMNHWVDQNTEEANRIGPTGWWVVFHEWADGKSDEERPDRPCDPDCLRKTSGLDSVECTCSRSRNEEPSDDLTEESNDPRSHAPVVFKIDNVQVRIPNDMRVEYENKDFGLSLVVVLSHEGIIMDVWKEGNDEPVATMSSTYEETLNGMLE